MYKCACVYCVFLNVYMSVVCTYVYTSLHVCYVVYLHARLCMCVYVCASVYMCVCAHVCIVHVYMCVCV